MWTPLGNPGSKAASLRFDSADYLLRVGSVADDYNTTHDILAVFVENAAAEFRSQMNGCDIADVDGCACRRGQDDVLKVCRRSDQADPPNGHLLVACFNDLRANVGVTALDTFDHGAQGDVVSAQFDGINVDLVLAYPTADAGHFCHARHRIQLVLDEPVLQGVQGPAVVGAFDCVPEDLAHTGCIRSQNGYDSLGQKTRCQVQPFQDPRAGKIGIDRCPGR